jgi:hypothetical protein
MFPDELDVRPCDEPPISKNPGKFKKIRVQIQKNQVFLHFCTQYA